MSAPSTPQEFVAKLKQIELKERSAAQAHFRDLCHILGEKTPEDADPKGEWYCFEKGATKTTGGEGWADVWMREHFGWEYKGKGKDLTAAFAQLQRYAPALENPPLLIVSDMDQIIVHTNWTNTVPKVHEIPLERLPEPEYLQVLRWAFTDPEKLTQPLQRASRAVARKRNPSRTQAPTRAFRRTPRPSASRQPKQAACRANELDTRRVLESRRLPW
jgi:hypothetical protein